MFAFRLLQSSVNQSINRFIFVRTAGVELSERSNLNGRPHCNNAALYAAREGACIKKFLHLIGNSFCMPAKGHRGKKFLSRAHKIAIFSRVSLRGLRTFLPNNDCSKPQNWPNNSLLWGLTVVFPVQNDVHTFTNRSHCITMQCVRPTVWRCKAGLYHMLSRPAGLQLSDNKQRLRAICRNWNRFRYVVGLIHSISQQFQLIHRLI